MLDGEEKIVALAQGGNSSAFGSLYDHYQPQIYRFIYLKVGGREEAEDLTHQVFLNAWLSVPKYKHKGFPFSSWLYQIAKNQVVDYYRSKHEVTSLESIDPESMVAIPSVELADEKLELDRATSIIRNLKPEYQDVLILRFVEDMAIKDVAKLLDKTEGAVKLLQHRAIKLLREAMGEESNESTEEITEENI